MPHDSVVIESSGWGRDMLPWSDHCARQRTLDVPFRRFPTLTAPSSCPYGWYMYMWCVELTASLPVFSSSAMASSSASSSM